MDSFAIRFIFLALPGVLGCKLCRAFAGKEYERAWEAVVDAVLFSAVGYLVAVPLRGASLDRSVEMFLEPKQPLDWLTILLATIVAVPIATLWAAAESHYWLYLLGQRLRVTRFVSKSDVWSLVLGDPRCTWRFVRDHARGLLYYGKVQAYSDSEELRELWLEDVTVYEARNGQLLFHTPDLYLAANVDALTIEAPPIPVPSAS